MTLYEVLPDKLEHRGKEYRLYASFDRVLEALAFVKRKDFSDAEKEEYLTFLFFGEGVEEEERRACLKSAEEVSPFLEAYSLDGNQKIYQVLALLE